MPNEQQAEVLAEARILAQQADNLIDAWEALRERFDSINVVDPFQGLGKLFALDGSGPGVNYDTFLGGFNSLGGLEGTTGTPKEKWDAFKAAMERLRP